MKKATILLSLIIPFSPIIVSAQQKEPQPTNYFLMAKQVCPCPNARLKALELKNQEDEALLQQERAIKNIKEKHTCKGNYNFFGLSLMSIFACQ